MTKELRELKVYGTSGYQYKTTPTIMLKGQWLHELGFDEGSLISVKCEDGKLTIVKLPDPEPEVVVPIKKRNRSRRA